MIGDYTVVYATNPDALAKNVKSWMKKGWHPIGGASNFVWHKQHLVMQCMVKPHPLAVFLP